MSWLACRSMRGPVRRLVHQTESYTHSTYRMAVRVHADDDGLGSDDGCRDMAEGRASGCMDDRMPMFCAPSFREAIDIADAVRSHRLRRIRFTIVRCVSMLLIVGAVTVASLPFAMQARSARRLAETSDSAARAVAGWPYPMAENELERAHEYNRRLAAEGQPVLGETVDPFSAAADGGVGGSVVSVADVDTEYQGLLDSGAGIMGTVLVPGIGVELPIRHGTSEPVLAVGAGHLYGTSLPVGGEGTHAVVTGHRGLAASMMFTRLDELDKGDFMYVKVMGETLGYEVDRISVIEPDDVSKLKIVPGEDRLTLMTCTPYGVNTHRLLVSGHRVALPTPAPDPADVHDPRADGLNALAVVVGCVAGGMTLCCLIVRSIRPRRIVMRHAFARPAGM